MRLPLELCVAILFVGEQAVVVASGGCEIQEVRIFIIRVKTFAIFYKLFVMAFIFVPLKSDILEIATDDADIIHLGSVLVPAVLIGTYLNILVGNITSGIFGGMGRPIIATILSFGLELPLSIGGTALMILYFKTNLLGVYWFQAISGGFEALILFGILGMSNWDQCADEARARQETSTSRENEAGDGDDDEADETQQESSTSLSGVDDNEDDDIGVNIGIDNQETDDRMDHSIEG